MGRKNSPETMAYQLGHKTGFLGEIVKNPYAKRGGQVASDWLVGYAAGQAKRQADAVSS